MIKNKYMRINIKIWKISPIYTKKEKLNLTILKKEIELVELVM